MPDASAIQVRGAVEQDEEQILHLLSTVWPQQDNAAFLKTDPGYQTNQTRVLEINGQIVSCLQVFDRRVRLGGGSVRVGCVANVATHPAHRRRGYATRVLRDALAFMRNEGHDASMLFTDVPQVYARLGWRIVRQCNAWVHLKPPAVSRSAGPWRVRLGDWDRDLDELRRIYDACNEGRTGPVLRSKEYWIRHRLKLHEEDPAGFLVAERKGHLGAYTRCRSDSNIVMEIGHWPGECDALQALFVALHEWLDERFDRTLVLHIPRDAETERLLNAVADRTRWHVPPVETPHIEYIMIRPISAIDIKVFDGLLFHYSDHF